MTILIFLSGVMVGIMSGFALAAWIYERARRKHAIDALNVMTGRKRPAEYKERCE